MIRKAKKHVVKAFSTKKHDSEDTQLSSLRIAAGIFLVVIISVLVGYSAGLMQQEVVTDKPPEVALMSANEIEAKTVLFVKSLVPEEFSVSSDGMTETNGVYKISLVLSYLGESQTYESYVTKDGSLLFESGVPIIVETAPEVPEDNQPADISIVQSEKPVVELFVMSHCPYGTQAEKGMIPVVNALGSKIDFSIKFVYYAMHGKTEIDEQTLQYCINEEKPEKFISYLTCFLEDGNTERCLSEEGIARASLESCISETDAKHNITGMYEDKTTWLSGYYPLFNVFKEENEEYGVQGSPSLVINGVLVNSARDSASLLKTVCGAFIEQPEECSLALSSVAPSAGFGYSEGAETEATCG